MSALLSRANRKTGAIRLGLIAHTVAMFSFVTIYVTVDFHILSISHIDNRAFPGGDGLPPGPVGYRLFLYSKPIGMIIQVMFLLNNWLANGLLVSSVSKDQSPGCSTAFPVVSLLCYLYHGLSGHCPPVSDLPHLHRYVVEPPRAHTEVDWYSYRNCIYCQGCTA